MIASLPCTVTDNAWLLGSCNLGSLSYFQRSAWICWSSNLRSQIPAALPGSPLCLQYLCSQLLFPPLSLTGWTKSSKSNSKWIVFFSDSDFCNVRGTYLPLPGVPPALNHSSASTRHNIWCYQETLLGCRGWCTPHKAAAPTQPNAQLRVSLLFPFPAPMDACSI